MTWDMEEGGTLFFFKIEDPRQTSAIGIPLLRHNSDLIGHIPCERESSDSIISIPGL